MSLTEFSLQTDFNKFPMRQNLPFACVRLSLDDNGSAEKFIGFLFGPQECDGSTYSCLCLAQVAIVPCQI